MSNYGFQYTDDKGELCDFLGVKSYIFASVKITKNNLSGFVACPISDGVVKFLVVKSELTRDGDFAYNMYNTHTIDNFSVSVSGRVVQWNISLDKYADIIHPEITIVCYVSL